MLHIIVRIEGETIDYDSDQIHTEIIIQESGLERGGKEWPYQVVARLKCVYQIHGML